MALPLVFFNEISQNLHNLWNFSCRSFKSRKIKGLQRQYSCYLQFCVFFLYFRPIWSYEFFLSTFTRKGTNMFNGLANLSRKFHRRKRDKSCSRDPYFLRRRTLHDGREPRQDLYLSMRRLLTSVAIWQSFPRCFLFSVFVLLCSHPDLARSKNHFRASLIQM